jgi:ribosome biogenesis protein Nip4
MDKNLQKQMTFNEKLTKLFEKIEEKKPFNYDIIFGKNSH